MKIKLTDTWYIEEKDLVKAVNEACKKAREGIKDSPENTAKKEEKE